MPPSDVCFLGICRDVVVLSMFVCFAAKLPNVAGKDQGAKFDELERVEKLKGKQLQINLKVGSQVHLRNRLPQCSDCC